MATRTPRFTTPKKSSARKLVDAALVHLGWRTDETRPDCQVFSERAKTVEQAAKLGGAKPDYLLYPDGDTPLAVIETKRPGKTLHQAVADAVRKYATPLSINVVFASDGTLYETYDRRSDSPLMLDSEPVTRLLTPHLVTRFAREGPSITSPTQVRQTRTELMSAFARANDLLRKDGLRAGTERFTEFSSILFLKLISEFESDREERDEPRRLEARYCWDAFAEKSPRDMFDYIQDTVLPRLVDRYNNSGDVFRSQLLIRTPSVLADIVTALHNLQLLNADSDVKGDAFEYFVKNAVTVGNDLGEYFTPRHIVRLIVELVNPVYGETVYDPCCGTGGFLIEAFRHILRKVKRSPESLHRLEKETIFGRELTGTSSTAKMNMILAGDGHTNISQEDSLASPVRGGYDVVLTNFPFSQETDYGHLYDLATANANPVFLRHALDACKPGGRVGVVVPEGLLFAETEAYIHVRKYLVDNFAIHAVIALHDFVFRPYTGQPTAILILTKEVPTEDEVWFYEIKEDGFVKTTSRDGRPPLDGDNDLIGLRGWWDNRSETDRAFAVPIDDIRNNAYKLSVNSYGSDEEPQHWQTLGGKDGICELTLGKTPNPKDTRYYQDGNYPFIRIADMTGKRYVTKTEKLITQVAVSEKQMKLVPAGTVLLAFKLSIGRVAITTCDAYTNEAILAVTPKCVNILPEYLYHVLSSMDLNAYTQRAAKGPTLNKSIISKIRIPVPTLDDQRDFVARMNDLEAMAIQRREEAREFDKERSDAGVEFMVQMR